MASPMRKKRAWSTREDDAESKETAAFEASVAAAQDTAEKSGAFLSSAKEDLTDHKRWLHAQGVAVERDRQRHERWLQRQRDHRLALARKERTRRRRQLMRQRAVLATQQALVAGVVFVRSWIVFSALKVWAGLKYLVTSIAQGFAFVGRQAAAGVRWTASKLGRGIVFVGNQVAAGVRWTGSKLGLAVNQAGKQLSAGATWSGANARASVKAGGSALASGSSLVAAKTKRVSSAAGRSLGAGLSVAGAKGSVLAGATGGMAARGFARLATRASAASAAGKAGLVASYRWSKSHAAALGPAVYVRVAKFGREAERYARTRTAGARSAVRHDVSAPSPASVHVIEVYGPHEKDVQLFGGPANEPRTPQAEAQDDPRGAEVYGPFYEGFWVEGISPNEPRVLETDAPLFRPVVSRAETESAISLWAQGAAVRAKTLAMHARDLGVGANTWAWSQAGRAKSWAGAKPWAGGKRWASAKSWAKTLSWYRERDVDLSQMMIIAGAVLLVCGGLLVGGGLLMRAGARTAVAEVPQETFSGIAWTFNEPDLPLPDRAVFTLTGTPDSFLINGLSISGVNNADQSLFGLEGVLKPDVRRPELKLTLQVDKPATPAGEAGSQSMEIVPKDAVPAHAPFRLVFPFPPEAMSGEDGITVEEFFDSYGGLLLKLRYELDGAEKSVIQYLSPDLLKAQLEEVDAQAGDS